MFRKLLFYCLILSIVFTITSCCNDDCDSLTAPQFIDPIASMPTDVMVTNPEIDVLNFTWIDNCDWEKEYRIDRRDSYYKSKDDEWINIARVPRNSESFCLENVPYDDFYEYRIYAFYDTDMRSEFVYKEYSIYLHKPVNPKTEKVDDSTLKISWEQEQGWIDGYKLEKKTSDSDWTEIAVLPKETKEYTDSNLNLNGYFIYRISAYKSEEYSYPTTTGYNSTEMIFVEGGTFDMGGSYNTSHQVTLSSFYISTYEITNLDYRLLAWNTNIYDDDEIEAVTMISWQEAVEFCNLKSEAENLTPYYIINGESHSDVEKNPESNGYRLPTEAEWEFAARGGNLSNNYMYSGSNIFSEVGTYTTYNFYVGTKLPNELGIYDMSGNAAELCYDIYDAYPTEPQINPQGANYGSACVLRGEYNDNVYDRHSQDFNSTSSLIGFRIVKNIPE